MTVKGRFSLDTNILVYAVDRDAGERHRRSRELVGQAARRDCVLTVQALAEFFHATTRKNLLRRVRSWLDGCRRSPRRCGRGTPAVVLGCRALGRFSPDRLFGDREDMQHGRRLSGVEFINPFAADAAPRLAALLDA